MSQTNENNKWAKKFKKAIEASLKAVENCTNDSVAGLYKELVRTTVVGDPGSWHKRPPPDYVPGKLKASWRVSKGTSINDIKTGQFSSVGKTFTIRLGDGDKKIMMYNQQPYLYLIEYGAHSKQAPNGFVRIAVSKFPELVKKSTDKNRTK